MLFDKDNPGKNLANATIWLDSSQEESSSSSSDESGFGGCFMTSLALAAVIFLISLVVSMLLRGCQ